MADCAEYPHFQRVESNFPANRAKTGKFDRKFESSTLACWTGLFTTEQTLSSQ
jgi:hypothetical protein